MKTMSFEIARGRSRASLLVLALACLTTPTSGADPAGYPGSVDNGNGTFTYVFRPSGGANNGTDQGGLTSGKDTFILHNESTVTANTNYGAANYTYHFNSTCNVWWGWSFFQWDVSSLPPANEVTKVTLVLSANILRGYGWPYQAPITEMVLQAPMTAWNEMTMTYNTRPALDPLVLGRASLPTGALVAPNTWFDGLVRFDITELYKQWSSGTLPNFGVACRRPLAWCENANSTLVFTSDHAEVAKRPALEIIYQGAASDTTPPVIAAPASILAEATGPQGAAIGFSVSAFDNKDGPVPVFALPPWGSVFPLGNSSVELTATDAAANVAHQTIAIRVVDTTPPVLALPANLLIEATSPAGAVATFASSATDLVDGNVAVSATPASGSTFTLGETKVTVTARDAAGNTRTGPFTVTVRDTTAPAITSVTTDAPTLGQPNHRMVAVTVSASASDTVGVASLKIVSVTSNEPDNGLGDGDTAGDIVITGNLTVNLRAERSGTGNGRSYTITVEAKDTAGNATTKSTAVFVPKSHSGK